MTDDSQLTDPVKYGRTPIQKQILDDHFDEGISIDILTAKYGRSQNSILRLITPALKAGRERLKRAGDRRSVLHASALTRVHKRVGMRFIRWRTIEHNYTMPEAAEAAGITINRLHSIEGGLHNWTLLELVYTCERMNWSLIDLLRGTDLGDYLQPDAA